MSLVYFRSFTGKRSRPNGLQDSQLHGRGAHQDAQFLIPKTPAGTFFQFNIDIAVL